ncbi:hypothetical protein [Streptomyces sp. CAU 1734]|uniref:hypothetical protein n=1 Tax=Streptomyces sp. CAU 1734 TaxID=3140360 RepID=UPI0032612751
MRKLSFQVTVHRVFRDGVVEDLTVPAGQDVMCALDFVAKVTAKGDWVVIAPEAGSGVYVEVSCPISTEMLSDIAFKALDAAQSVVVLPEEVIERGVVLSVLRTLSA